VLEFESMNCADLEALRVQMRAIRDAKEIPTSIFEDVVLIVDKDIL
jgi:hypothetical protein